MIARLYVFHVHYLENYFPTVGKHPRQFFSIGAVTFLSEFRDLDYVFRTVQEKLTSELVGQRVESVEVFQVEEKDESLWHVIFDGEIR